VTDFAATIDLCRDPERGARPRRPSQYTKGAVRRPASFDAGSHEEDYFDACLFLQGIILLVNIAPALLVKIGWPYFVHGAPRYGRRVAWCSLLSFIGILVCMLLC
jgi:hypothetical protein